jgi:hypothetical protein
MVVRRLNGALVKVVAEPDGVMGVAYSPGMRKVIYTTGTTAGGAPLIKLWP